MPDTHNKTSDAGSGGRVVGIFIAADEGAATARVAEVSTVAGCGIEGDRYFNAQGWADGGKHLTLIETEALDGLEREYGTTLGRDESRRNIATSGVALNHLVGREFRVGDEVVCRGIRLCEPCGHLEKLTGKKVRKGLVHRGGLRAQIVTGGVIREGDAICAS